MTTIRSSFTPDGQRLFLTEVEGGFRVQTRWQRITPTIIRIEDAIDAFEVLELCEGNLHLAYRQVRIELRRIPRTRWAGTAWQRTCAVLTGTEHRLAGRKIRVCGSKGSVREWIAAS